MPADIGETQPIIRIVGRLAGAVGAEEPEGLARRDVEVDGVDRGQLAEALGQAAGVDERFRGRRRADLGRTRRCERFSHGGAWYRAVPKRNDSPGGIRLHG